MATTTKKKRASVAALAQVKDSDRGIILCLSGGGLRATLFHIGFIRALREEQQLKNVTQVFAVSGGSIVAAHLALNWKNYNKTDGEFNDLINELTNFTKRDIRGRIVRRYICTFSAGFLPKWLAPFPRNLVEHLENQYRALFQDRTFADLQRISPTGPALHVIAASLTTGQSCSFSNKGFFVENSDGTVSQASDTNTTSLAKAVAASSAFPPLFPPVVITGDDLGESKSEWRVDHKLADGGVIDNLAVEKVFAHEGRKEFHDHHIIVSDAGAPFDWNTENSFTGYVGRNVRASTIMMNEISINTMRKIRAKIAEKKITYCSIDDQTAGPLAINVQKRLPTVRTDIDRFSDSEINALQTHGYQVTLQCIRAGKPVLVPNHPDLNQQLDETRLSTFAELRRSARRKLRLISFHDWVSIPATLIVLGIPAFTIVALYAGYSRLTTQIVETGALTGDISKIAAINNDQAREKQLLLLRLEKLTDHVVTLERQSGAQSAHTKCRDSSHGIESAAIDENFSGSSGWRSGGYSPNQWCNEFTAQLRGKFADATFKKLASSEIQRSRCSPFNCPEYLYTCEVNVKAPPIFKELVSNACPLVAINQ